MLTTLGKKQADAILDSFNDGNLGISVAGEMLARCETEETREIDIFACNCPSCQHMYEGSYSRKV
jgi:hypothetical protein